MYTTSVRQLVWFRRLLGLTASFKTEHRFRMESELISKRSLLEWAGGTLDLKITLLEQCSNAAIYCQLLDTYFSGVVHMHKVRIYGRSLWA